MSNPKLKAENEELRQKLSATYGRCTVSADMRLTFFVFFPFLLLEIRTNFVENFLKVCYFYIAMFTTDQSPVWKQLRKDACTIYSSMMSLMIIPNAERHSGTLTSPLRARLWNVAS
jgi:hypothetical protein